MEEEGISKADDKLIEKEEEANSMVPAITLSKRSKRLVEKRGRQFYQSGLITDMASKRKALLTELDIGIPNSSFSVFNIIPDDMLIFLANTCDINMGCNANEHSHNLAQLRALDSSRVDESERDAES